MMDKQTKSQLDPSIRKRKITLYTIAEVLAILALCVIGNVFDFVNMRFAFERITTAAYWEATLQQALLYSISLILGYLYKIERCVLDDPEFARGMDQYHDRLKLKTQSFPTYIDETLNPMIREEFYKDSIEHRLYKLERHAKDQWKLDYSHWLASKKPYEEFQFCGRRSKKYCNKRLTLEQLILKDNIASASSCFDAYPRVNAHSFTYGIHSDESKAGEWKTENTVSKDLTLIWLRKVLTVFLAAMIVGSIVADPDVTELAGEAYGWLKLLVKYAIRCGTMIMCLGTGLAMGRKIFESDYILVIENRIRILDMYVAWDVKQGSHEDPAYKILQYLQSLQDARDKDASPTPEMRN
jgi:hypothetical protein